MTMAFSQQIRQPIHSFAQIDTIHNMSSGAMLAPHPLKSNLQYPESNFKPNELGNYSFSLALSIRSSSLAGNHLNLDVCLAGRYLLCIKYMADTTINKLRMIIPQ
jgi:hypothetical protein